jgi:fumarate hydratase subunit alpha
MRKVTEKLISATVSRLCIRANTHLRPDAEAALRRAARLEKNARARKILRQLLQNARIARAESLAICQDTGLPVVFVEIGRDINCLGLDLEGAINAGIRDGYEKGFLRNSIVADPLSRGGSTAFGPAVIHFEFVPRRGLRLTVLPKGFGCENKTQLKMFNPTARSREIKDFIVSAVREAGPDACPPYTVGVGIGASADHASLLSKKALLRPLGKWHPSAHVAALERELLREINESGIGPMGLGGRATALGVHILTHPTHMAGLPVAVNISCHVLRSASALLK